MTYKRKSQRGGEVPIKFTKPEVSETSASSAIQGSMQNQKESNAEMAEMQKQMAGGGKEVVVPQMDQAGDSGNASISGGIANILKGAADSEYDADVNTKSSANSDYTGGKRKKRRKTRKQRGSNILNSKRFNPNKKMIHGMSEGTIRRLDNSDTSFSAIMKTRTNIRSGMSPLQAHRKAFNNSHLKEKDSRSLPKYLEWKKSNKIQTPAHSAKPKLVSEKGSRNLLQM